MRDLPTLKCIQKGDELVLYLSTISTIGASVLIKEEEGKQWLIYYTTHTLPNTEMRYTSLQKATLTLVCATRKLKPYLKSHTIKVHTDLPLKDILQHLEHSGHLAK